MPTMLTCSAHVKDWKALQEVFQSTLLALARQVGARRFQIYRNTQDAARALIVAELPDQDALRELRRTLNEQVEGPCLRGHFEDGVWELTGWTDIA
jgi:hypothetical protein